MAEFQTVLGIILIVCAVVIIAIAVYNLFIINKSTTNNNDSNTKLTDAEKKGGMGINVILIIVGLILGVYGVVLILPEKYVPAGGAPVLRGTRSLSGSVLSPTGEYM